jgi:hypothetical protein
MGGFAKWNRSFPPYLPLSIFIPLITTYLFFGIGIGHTRKGCTLPCGKKGIRDQRVKVVGKS